MSVLKFDSFAVHCKALTSEASGKFINSSLCQRIILKYRYQRPKLLIFISERYIFVGTGSYPSVLCIWCEEYLPIFGSTHFFIKKQNVLKMEHIKILLKFGPHLSI